MNELIPIRYACSVCGEENETEVDGSAGAKVNLVPLGAEAGGKLNRNQVQTIELVFAP